MAVCFDDRFALVNLVVDDGVLGTWWIYIVDHGDDVAV